MLPFGKAAQVKGERQIASLVMADMRPVQIDVAELVHGAEMQQDVFSGP